MGCYIFLAERPEPWRVQHTPENQKRTTFFLQDGDPLKETSLLFPSCSMKLSLKIFRFWRASPSPKKPNYSHGAEAHSASALVRTTPAGNRLQPCLAQDKHLLLLTSSNWPFTFCFQQLELALHRVCCNFSHAQKRTKNLGRQNLCRETPASPAPSQQTAGILLFSTFFWHMQRHPPVPPSP